MKKLSDALSVHLSLSVTNLATCMRIERNDGVFLRWTSHDNAITIAGDVYEPNMVSETEGRETMGFEVSTMEIHGLITDNASMSSSILEKLYDRAKIDVFQVDYTNPPDGISASSVLWLLSGVVGDIDVENGLAVIEARSLIDLLSQKTLTKTSRLCRSEFGDSNCRVDLTGYQKTGSVTSASGKTLVLSITGLVDGDLDNGKLVSANGAIFDVYRNNGATIVLSEIPETDLTGQTVTVTFGCNKWLTDCEKYGNIINYNGEPYIPDDDEWAAGYFDTVGV